jgi:mono/diheme cytochrome c family protein
MRLRALSGLSGLIVLAPLYFVGCTREAPLTYVISEPVQELPTLHQEQIESTLTRLFGSPLEPRLMMPSESEGSAEDSDEAETQEPPLESLVDAAQLAHGARVYRNQCAGCHGVSGDGNGAAAPYLQPRPRDYRQGVFKFTSTAYGSKPTRSDLERIIRRGARGTSMPAFRWMPEEDLNAVIRYVMHLSYRGELERYLTQVAMDYDEEEEIDPAEFFDAMQRIHGSWVQAGDRTVHPRTPPPQYSSETVLAGRKAFLSRGCSKCHGDDGRGQTDWLSHEFLAEQEAKPEHERVQLNRDAWGHIAPAADLTAGMLHGGRRPVDIYRRIYSGINGTPMPGFADALAEEPDTIWHLVHYITSIVEGGPVRPEGAEGVEATEGQDAAEGQEGVEGQEEAAAEPAESTSS